MNNPTTTGEWTVVENWDKEGTIAQLQCGEGENIKVIKSENPALFHAIRYLKRLHNAALAAEGDKWRKAMSAAADLAKQTFTEKDKQLAAESENTKDAQEEAFSAYAEIDEIRDQLAAEREKVHYWQGIATQEWHKGFAASHDEHQKQLAAERSKVQTLVDALKWMADGHCVDMFHVRRNAEAAISKVKEGK